MSNAITWAEILLKISQGKKSFTKQLVPHQEENGHVFQTHRQ
jgi:hypothetical protein